MNETEAAGKYVTVNGDRCYSAKAVSIHAFSAAERDERKEVSVVAEILFFHVTIPAVCVL